MVASSAVCEIVPNVVTLLVSAVAPWRLWDVSPLIHLTPETANEVAFNVARALLQNPVKKRSHKKKPAAPAHEFSEAEVAGLWAMSRLVESDQRIAA